MSLQHTFNVTYILEQLSRRNVYKTVCAATAKQRQMTVHLKVCKHKRARMCTRAHTHTHTYKLSPFAHAGGLVDFNTDSKVMCSIFELGDSCN